MIAGRSPFMMLPPSPSPDTRGCESRRPHATPAPLACTSSLVSRTWDLWRIGANRHDFASSSSVERGVGVPSDCTQTGHPPAPFCSVAPRVVHPSKQQGALRRVPRAELDPPRTHCQQTFLGAWVAVTELRTTRRVLGRWPGPRQSPTITFALSTTADKRRQRGACERDARYCTTARKGHRCGRRKRGEGVRSAQHGHAKCCREKKSLGYDWQCVDDGNARTRYPPSPRSLATPLDTRAEQGSQARSEEKTREEEEQRQRAVIDRHGATYKYCFCFFLHHRQLAIVFV